MGDTVVRCGREAAAERFRERVASRLSFRGCVFLELELESPRARLGTWAWAPRSGDERERVELRKIRSSKKNDCDC
jgi:hypothetical protein